MPQPILEPYQRQCCDFIKSHPKCAVFLDIGYGKTLTTLQAIFELKLRTVLVVAPKAISRTTWHKEIRKWDYPFEAYSMVERYDEKKGKKKEIPMKDLFPLYSAVSYAGTQKPSVFITSRDRLSHLVSWCEANDIWPFDMVVCDEFQSFKDGSAKRTKSLILLAGHTRRIVGLTGTPMPKSIEDVWSEIRILDGGARLGKYVTHFRNEYMYSTMVVNGHSVGWKAKPGAKQRVFAKISDIAISVDANLSLPPLTIHDVPIILSQSEMDLYTKFARSGVLDLEDVDKAAALKSGEDNTVLTPANAAVLAGKLLQIASGTVYDELRNMYEIHSEKLAMLQHIIDNTGGPVLVAYSFRCDEKRILDNIWLRPGEVAVKFDGSEEMQDAWNRGEYKVMLLQPASCCHGINLQDGGSCLVWYTLPHSYEQYEQTNGRLYRKGQKKPVIIHRLIAEGTFDRRVVSNLLVKGDDNESLLDAVRREVSSLYAD